MGFTCFAPYPALIGTHKAVGPTDRDSDIGYGETTSWREKPETTHIVYSTRLNFEALISGSPYLKSQWPYDTLLQDTVTEELAAIMPIGHVVDVKREEFWEEEKVKDEYVDHPQLSSSYNLKPSSSLVGSPKEMILTNFSRIEYY
jgi:hypothetical protein